MGRFDADHPHRRPQRLDGGADPGNQPAAADGHYHRVQVWHLFDDLQPHGSLPVDDVRVVEAGHVGPVGLLGDGQCLLPRLVIRFSFENDLGPEGPAVAHFDQRRRFGHVDGHRNAQQLAVAGQAQRMVAGRCGDHAPAAPLGGDSHELVTRTALLERPGDLQIVQLGIDRAPAEPAQGQRIGARAMVDRVLDCRLGPHGGWSRA